VIDRPVGELPYLAGEYSLADMTIYPWIKVTHVAGARSSRLPNVKQWYKAIEERPAVQRGVAVMAGVLALQPADKDT
jgi:GSH-dependent disulfide-bond oxidoreductase